jgi:two-component system, cell cycle sensor histidine kinase and response regulator CckA
VVRSIVADGVGDAADEDPGELETLRRRVAELEASLVSARESNLRDARDFVHTILDTIPDPIFIKDERHVWILLNEAFCNFMGHPREALLGKSDHDFFPKAEADVFWQLDDMLFATGIANENEESFTDRRGEVHVISTKKALCRDAAGNKILAGVIRDITGRVRAEEALRSAHENLERRVRERTADLEQANRELRESEERFRATFEQAAVGIAHVSTDGRFLRVNQRLCEIVGYSQEELLERTFRDITVPEDVEVGTEVLQAAVTTSAVERSFDKRYMRKDGSMVWAHLTTSLAHDVEGRPTYLITVIEDVSARKLAEEALRKSELQLRQAQKMEAVGRLAGGVAHDFNNLLTAIIGCCSLAQKRTPTGGEVGKLLDDIQVASHRAAGLTRQLLAFSRQQVLQPKVLDLNEVIEEAMTLLRRVIGEDVEIRTTLAPGLAPARVDQDQFVQVLMNLAVNARDAMPEGGTLSIETANVTLDASTAERLGLALGEYIVCSVSDTGCGMDAATQARLFEPFFTTKPLGKGTGLGLPTVYGIVKQSGGTVSVYSELGLGATFKIYLPRASSEATPRATNVERPSTAPGSETVLLVDDDEAVRSVVSRQLEANGYVVLTAKTPEDALELAAAHREPIHVFLTDMVMPRMNGRQLAERVVVLHPEAKVVFMSGYAPNAIVDRGVLDEGTCYLEKPFAEIDLLRALRGRRG